MNNYKDYYEYKIEIVDKESKKGKSTFYGVTYGEDYLEASRNVLHYYRGETILSLTLELWDCNACIEMSQSVLEDLRRDG